MLSKYAIHPAAVPISVLVSALLVSATIVWEGRRIECKLGSFQAEPSAPAVPRAQPAASPGSQPPSALGAPAPAEQSEAQVGPGFVGAIAVESVFQTWERKLAHQAEAQCWQPLDRAKTYPVLPDAVRFKIELNADGVVLKADPVVAPRMPKPPVQLHDCIAKIMLAAKLPPSGAGQTVEIQVSRPPRR